MTQQISPRLKEFLQGVKKLYMNGELVESASGKTLKSYNPATGEELAEVSEALEEDIDSAVRAAREAFDTGPWSKMGTAERSRLMNKLADLMDDHKLALA